MKNKASEKVYPGAKFGKWTVIERRGMTKNRNALWLCKCECGAVKEVSSRLLTTGQSKSCGCSYIHRFVGTRMYNSWRAMKARCSNPNNNRYYAYGARGISYTEEWEDFKNFKEWALQNGYKDNLTLDRIDCDGNYEPSNCRWITLAEQADNKRTNHKLEAFGEIHSIAEWSRITGIPYDQIEERVNRKGYGAEEALSKNGKISLHKKQR